jgi:uncharacterized protein
VPFCPMGTTIADEVRLSDMKIQISGLSEGVHKFLFQVPASGIGLGENFRNDVVVSTTIDKTANQLFLQTTTEVTGTFTCDRCVAEFKETIRPSYQMVYVMEPADYGSVDPSELQVVPPGTSTIDIAEDVRQTVLLAVPLKLLCKDSCKGLCPHCGQNLNDRQCDCKEITVDSRWEGLRKIMNNQ